MIKCNFFSGCIRLSHAEYVVIVPVLPVGSLTCDMWLKISSELKLADTSKNPSQILPDPYLCKDSLHQHLQQRQAQHGL